METLARVQTVPHEWRSASMALVGGIRALLKAAGEASKVENGRQLDTLYRATDWIQKAQKKNAINRYGLWRYEYARRDLNPQPSVPKTDALSN